MKEEYEAVRPEMLRWQDRRFDMLKLSITLVVGLLGLKLLTPGSLADVWPFVSSVLLLYLAAANLLTWYAGIANSKLAAYIVVYFEQAGLAEKSFAWESRLTALKKEKLDPYNLNICMSIIYVGLALVAGVVPYATSGFTPPTCAAGWALVVSAALFTVSGYLAAFKAYRRETYEGHWKTVKQKEGRG